MILQHVKPASVGVLKAFRHEVKNLVMLNPFPLSLSSPFFVGANSTAVTANGVPLAQDLDSSQACRPLAPQRGTGT